MQDMEQAIRERAYQLWIESGFEHGNADGHWLAAQREVLQASLSGLGHLTPSETKPAKPKKVRAARRRVA